MDLRISSDSPSDWIQKPKNKILLYTIAMGVLTLVVHFWTIEPTKLFLLSVGAVVLLSTLNFAYIVLYKYSHRFYIFVEQFDTTEAFATLSLSGVLLLTALLVIFYEYGSLYYLVTAAQFYVILSIVGLRLGVKFFE